jgi:hypothetical protein
VRKVKPNDPWQEKEKEKLPTLVVFKVRFPSDETYQKYQVISK